MKLISLNTWRGKLLDLLVDYIQKYKEVDLFCLQEIYDSKEEKILGGEMKQNLFAVISKILHEHNGFFAPTTTGYNMKSSIDSNLKFGRAIFYQKDIEIRNHSDFFVFRNDPDLVNNDNRTAAKKFSNYIEAELAREILEAYHNRLIFLKPILVR